MMSQNTGKVRPLLGEYLPKFLAVTTRLDPVAKIPSEKAEKIILSAETLYERATDIFSSLGKTRTPKTPIVL